MELDIEKRLEIYRAAPLEVQRLYESNGELMRQVASEININDPEKYKIFALTIGDIILKMYKKDSLPQLLKDRLQLTDEQATSVTSKLQPLLIKIPDLPTQPVKPILLEAPPPTILADAPEKAVASPEPPVTPEVDPVTNVKPLRTFAMDVDFSRAHGYGAFRNPGEGGEDETPTHSSNQDDIIKQ